MLKKIEVGYIVAFIVGIALYKYGMYMSIGGVGLPILYIEVISILIVIYAIIKNKFKIKVDKPTLFIICLLFLISTIPLVYNFNTRSIEGIKTTFFMGLIYTAFIYLFSTKDINECMKIFNLILYTFIGYTFVELINIVITNKLYNESQIYMYKSYIVLPYGASNYIAEFILYFTIVSFVTTIEEEKLSSAIYFFIGSISIFITNSRGAIISLLITTIIYIILNIRKTKLKGVLLIGIVILIIILISLRLSFIELMFNRFTTKTGNVSSRLTQYVDMLNYIYSGSIIQLLFGLGMGSETMTSPILIHNVIIKIVHNIGLVGLTVYSSYYFIYVHRLKKCIKARRNLKKYLYAFISILVGSMIEVALYTSFMEYFMAINCALIYSIHVKLKESI